MRTAKHEVENSSNASIDGSFGVVLLPVMHYFKSIAKKQK